MDKRFPIEDQIEMLASALRGRVVTPRHADYDAIRLASLANADAHRPAAVIRVANAADVAASVNFARATGLPLAIRSGGHSTAGHSTADKGLVIDLRQLNGLDIDAEARTAWAGAGLTAGEVTAAVSQHGLIVGFGDAATVGIGGITLGGGIGFLTRKHGLTIDSVLAIELVTAQGEIVVADARNHPDLFWALRGGGGNFGVATRFKYRLHPLPSFIGGPLILPATPEVVVGFVKAAEAAPDELSSIAALMPLPPLPFIPAEMHGKLVLMAMMAFSGAPEAADRVLAPFRALGPIADLVRPGPYNSVYVPEDPFRPAVSIRSQFVEGIDHVAAARIIAHMTECPAPMAMAQIRVLGGAMARVGEDATAFAHRKGRILFGYLAFTPDPRQALLNDTWAIRGIREMGTRTASYVNFLDNEGPEALKAAYPAATLERLRRVKRRYDPENLFRLNQNILPG